MIESQSEATINNSNFTEMFSDSTALAISVNDGLEVNVALDNCTFENNTSY